MVTQSESLTDFATCAEVVNRVCRPYRLFSDRWRDFRGSVRNFNAAYLNLTALSLGRSCMRRDPAAAPDGGHYYSLLFQVRGASTVQNGRTCTSLASGDLVLLDSGQPIMVELSEGSQQLALNYIDASDTDIIDRATRQGHGKFSSHVGSAALLRDSLQSVVVNADHLAGVDLRPLALELLLVALGTERKGRADLGSMARFVDAHLGLASLCPQQIAGHFGVSLRQLYRITATAGQTPAGLIWERRLQCARELLRGNSGETVTSIAFRCGFKDSGHFARAYRKAFGQAPGATRSGMAT